MSSPRRVPARFDHVAVVVPACNERDRIDASLCSILRACEQLPAGVTSRCIVAVDASTDDTAAVAATVLRPHDLVLEVGVGGPGCVGDARRAGSEAAIVRSPSGPDRTWIATTDADTIVPEDWLTGQLGHAERGAAAVAGIVHLLDDAGDDDGFRSRHLRWYEQRYERAAGDWHPHVHGANLGFRADAYVAAGGWGRLRTGEDHDLWNRLRTVGPAVSTTSSVVTTSSRRIARAPAGFAADLVALDGAAS